MEKSEIDTPALVIDLDLVEKNLKTLTEFLHGKRAVARPHFKTPKRRSLHGNRSTWARKVSAPRNLARPRY